MEVWPEFLAGSWGREFIAGGVGGMAGVMAGHPLDTLRIHLQQPHVVGSTAISNSAFSVIRRINAVGGPLGFYKGMGAPLTSVPFQVFSICMH
jgi:solute carrier family 25 carnitine/acylcarnitine transporter 20/29